MLIQYTRPLEDTGLAVFISIDAPCVIIERLSSIQHRSLSTGSSVFIGMQVVKVLHALLLLPVANLCTWKTSETKHWRWWAVAIGRHASS